MAFQVPRQFLIGRDANIERDISHIIRDLLYSMVFLSPPPVINVIVMIAGTRYRHLKEIRIKQHSRCRHETATGVSVYADPVDIHEFITSAQLLDSHFMIRHRIITQISISIIMIPLGATGMPSPMSHAHHDKSGLRQTIRTRIHRDVAKESSLLLRSGVYIVNDRIYFRGIKIKRLIHDTIQIGHPIGRLYRKRLREFITCHE